MGRCRAIASLICLWSVLLSTPGWSQQEEAETTPAEVNTSSSGVLETDALTVEGATDEASAVERSSVEALLLQDPPRPSWEREARVALQREISRLVPYDLSESGQTFEALAALAPLFESLDPRTASTARFVRAAAAVDLLAFAAVVGEGGLRRRVADALATEIPRLGRVLDQELEGASCGFFAVEVRSLRSILPCVVGPADVDCRDRFRAVAASGGAGAMASRLMLLDEVLTPARRAQRANPEERARLVVSVVDELCGNPPNAEVSLSCEALENIDDERLSGARVRVVSAHAAQVLRSLRRYEEGGDPLGALSSTWIDRAQRQLGWTIVREPFSPATVPHVTPPLTNGLATLPPLELLIVTRRGVYTALSPATLESGAGSERLDELLELGLPGRQVLELPGRFRPVVRPLPDVVEGLESMRQAVEEVFRAHGGDQPTWSSDSGRSLGLLVDGDVSIVDLARYVQSAQRAGYERFELLGRRDDGQLAVVDAEFGSLRRGPHPRQVPRMRIGPREVRFTPNGGNAITVPRADVGQLAEEAAPHLESGRLLFTAVGRPMMPYRFVLPPIGAVAAAAEEHRAPMLFLLP